MTGLEITLFILGTAFIIISFFIVDTGDRTPKAAAASALDADAFEQLRTDFAEKSAKEADIILHETEDKLEAVSNDKIIAVGEYSDQILEKIGSNHKEVVFLYQMLNDKEEELKTTATKMDNIRIECEKLLREVKEAQEKPAPVVPARTMTVKQTVATGAPSTPAAQPVRTAGTAQPAQPVQNIQKSQSAQPVKRTAATQPARTAKPAQTTGTTVRKPVTKPAAGASTVATGRGFSQSIPAEEPDTHMVNRNDEIIALYKSGKSVMEISKLLGMGQGEVKLIIDLYC